MEGITCDLCGKPLLVDEETRYVADVTIIAAYDPMELTSSDLAGRDIAAEIRATIAGLQNRDTKELEEEIYLKRRFDLCPSCRKQFLKTLPE